MTYDGCQFKLLGDPGDVVYTIKYIDSYIQVSWKEGTIKCHKLYTMEQMHKYFKDGAWIPVHFEKEIKTSNNLFNIDDL